MLNFDTQDFLQFDFAFREDFTSVVLDDDSQFTRDFGRIEFAPPLLDVVITGTAGGDILVGTDDDDIISGAGGDDVIAGRGGDDLLNGGPGDDMITSGAGQDLVNGGLGNDIITLIGDGSVANGNAGDDVFFIGVEGGLDLVFNGGAGFDTVDLGELDGTIPFTFTVSSVEEVFGSEFQDFFFFNGRVTVSGRGGNDTITGSGFADTISGDDGDDFIFGGGGADVLGGGAGIDFLQYNLLAATEGVTINLSNNTASGGDAQGDAISGFENVVGTLEGEDSLTGNGLNNELFSLGGNDTVNGLGGDDLLAGGAGNDTLNGNAGDDDLFGEAGEDELIGAAGDDLLAGGAGNDTLNGGAGEDDLFGEDGDDTLIGAAGEDDLSGGAGNDTLNGGDQADTLSGGIGNDTLVGGAGGDTLFGDAGDDTLVGGTGIDELNGGDGADILNGGGGMDILFGGQGDDRLLAGNANDTLNGGAGDDRLIGGAGDDIFEFSTGRDVITDFTVGADTLSVDPVFATSFADLTITQAGTSTVVRVDGFSDGSFVLLNTTASDITEDSFVFGESSITAPGGLADGIDLSLFDTLANLEVPAVPFLSEFATGVGAPFASAEGGGGTAFSGDTAGDAFSAELIDLFTATDDLSASAPFNAFDFALL